MKKLGGFLLIGAFVLSGCAATPEPAATEAALDNTAACELFEEVTVDLGETMATGSTADTADEFVSHLAEMPARFDEAMLMSDGDVKTRIGTLITNLPDEVANLYIDSGEFFTDAASVKRACGAEGVDILEQLG
jgi:hypothetical protein